MVTVLMLCAFWLPAQAVPAQSAAFVVVVNEGNVQTSMSRLELSRLFLKKVIRWKPSNLTVFPIDREESSVIRQQFSTQIHGKGTATIKAYWQRRIFSGRDVPPLVKRDDRAVLEYVSRRPGAVGYVSVETDLAGYSVRVVHVE